MKRLAFLAAALLLLALPMQAQKNNEVYALVEEQPSFPGGNEAYLNYLAQNLVYPQQAEAQRIEGKVIVEFVVEKDGSLSHIVVKQDIGYGCGASAARALAAMPHWNPAKVQGEAVRCKYTCPVTFACDSARRDIRNLRHTGTLPAGMLLPPAYRGGDGALIAYLNSRTGSLLTKATGPIQISFTVCADGHLKKVHIEGASGKLKRALQEAFEKMPAWLPAMSPVRRSSDRFNPTDCPWSIELLGESF